MPSTKTDKRPSGKRTEVPQDEPGAEERFRGILKRALNTPPLRKRGAAPKGKSAKKVEGKP